MNVYSVYIVYNVCNIILCVYVIKINIMPKLHMQSKGQVTVYIACITYMLSKALKK